MEAKTLQTSDATGVTNGGSVGTAVTSSQEFTREAAKARRFNVAAFVSLDPLASAQRLLFWNKGRISEPPRGGHDFGCLCNEIGAVLGEVGISQRPHFFGRRVMKLNALGLQLALHGFCC